MFPIRSWPKARHYFRAANQAELETYRGLANGLNTENISRLRLIQAQAEEACQLWLKKLEHTYGRYYQLKYVNPDQPALAHIQPALAQDSLTMLNYFYRDGHLFTLIITGNHISFRRQKPGHQLVKLIEDFRLDMANLDKGNPDDLKDYVTRGLKIYHSIWPNSASLSERVLIIPDGILHLLPFDALLTDVVKSFSDPSTFPYLFYQHRFLFAPSATVWLGLRNKASHSAEKPFLSVAPEAFSQAELAPFASNHTNHQNITDLLDGELIGGKAATESRFKSVAHDYRVIHLFTHAKANDEFPLLSSIFFQKEVGDQEDQILHLGEILNLKLQADLVCLPACQSLIGKVMTGEGGK